MSPCALGVDIGGTKIAVGAVDAAGVVHARRTIATDAEAGFDAGLERLTRAIDETLAEARVGAAALSGIGLGCPGPFDEASGRIENFYTLPGWEGNDIVSPLVARFDTPVRLINDADAALLGEALAGAARGARVALMLTIGTGLGGAALIDGAILSAGADEAVAAARKVVAACGIATVVVTRSSRGMAIVAGDAVEHLPVRAREVFDVSGAGDTVIATLAAALGGGASLGDAAALANLAAGVVVAKLGTAVAYPVEIMAALQDPHGAGAAAKLVDLDGVRDRAGSWRRRRLRIGFTNGCFDVLHPGHVHLLQQARAACDRLVVGLNGDQSVTRLKGPERPVHGAGERAMMLAAHGAVDLVVVFDEDTPLALIEALRPDVLVKGADYRLDEVVGADAVRGWGGEVVLAELKEGHSTTRTLARLRRSQAT